MDPERCSTPAVHSGRAYALDHLYSHCGYFLSVYPCLPAYGPARPEKEVLPDRKGFLPVCTVRKGRKGKKP